MGKNEKSIAPGLSKASNVIEKWQYSSTPKDGFTPCSPGDREFGGSHYTIFCSWTPYEGLRILFLQQDESLDARACPPAPDFI